MPKTPDIELPHSFEAEKALLGSILLQNECLPAALEALTAADFYSARHQIIFPQMAAIAQKQQRIDLITLAETLKAARVLDAAGGAEYLASLTEGVPIGANGAFGDYVRIVKEKAEKREQMREGHALAEAIERGESPERIAGYAEKLSRRSRGEKKPAAASLEYPLVPRTAWYGPMEFYRRAFEMSTNASDNYHAAGFLTMTGISLGKSVLTQEGGDDIYPNVYTVIVGKAGLARKDSANNRAIKFLRAVDPDVLMIETIGSIEQFIGTMQNAQKEHEKGGYDGPLRVCLRFRELQGLIAKANQKATSNIWSSLCSLYDCPPEMTTAVKNNNAIVIQPVGAMQAATCPEWLKNLQRIDLEAGPGRRILWVPGDPKARIKRRQKPLPQYIEPVIKLVKERVDEYLKRAEPTVIPFSLEATDYIDGWAEKHEGRISGNELIDSLIAGDEVAVRKIALIHAAIERSHEISLLHLQAAIAFVEFLYEARFPVFSEHGVSPLLELENKILRKVEDCMPLGIGWRTLRRSGFQRIEREVFERVMKTLTIGVDPPLRVDSEKFGRPWVYTREE